MERVIEDVYIGDDCVIQAECAGGLVFIHCTLLKHNKSTIKKAINYLHQVKSDKGQPLHSYVEDGRLSKLAGGELINTFEYYDKKYEVYRWV